jgi:hypothetical protein
MVHTLEHIDMAYPEPGPDHAAVLEEGRRRLKKDA